MKKLCKHDKIVKSLEARLEDSVIPYNTIMDDVEYPRGQIDLLGIYKSYCLFFEMKSTLTQKSYKKARSQLQRMSDKYASNKMRNFYFLVYGDKNNTYKIKQIRVE